MRPWGGPSGHSWSRECSSWTEVMADLQRQGPHLMRHQLLRIDGGYVPPCLSSPHRSLNSSGLRGTRQRLTIWKLSIVVWLFSGEKNYLKSEFSLIMTRKKFRLFIIIVECCCCCEGIWITEYELRHNHSEYIKISWYICISGAQGDWALMADSVFSLLMLINWFQLFNAFLKILKKQQGQYHGNSNTYLLGSCKWGESSRNRASSMSAFAW